LIPRSAFAGDWAVRPKVKKNQPITP